MRTILSIVIVAFLISACKKEATLPAEFTSQKSDDHACFDSFNVIVNTDTFDVNLIGKLHNDIIAQFPSDFELKNDSCSHVYSFLYSLDSTIRAVHPSLLYVDTGMFNCVFATDMFSMLDGTDAELLSSFDSFATLAHDTLMIYNFISIEESVFLNELVDSLVSGYPVDFCKFKKKWEVLGKSSKLNGVFSGAVLSIAYHSNRYWSSRLSGKVNIGIITALAGADVIGAYVGAIGYVIDVGASGNSRDFGRNVLYGAVSSSLVRFFIPI